jgi:hypothetical protein
MALPEESTLALLGMFMGKMILAVVLLSSLLYAGENKKYHTGQLLQMESIQCVVFQKHPDQGPDSSLCEEYVLQSDEVLFHFRPKGPKHISLLPVGKTVEYRIEEGHFYLRLADHKDLEFTVVSMEPHDQNAPPVRSTMKINHLQ